jgi:hypothetical protein
MILPRGERLRVLLVIGIVVLTVLSACAPASPT